ncbi:MAG: hypothetical protein HEQ23_12205 [Tepidisphaera sp.]
MRKTPRLQAVPLIAIALLAGTHAALAQPELPNPAAPVKAPPSIPDALEILHKAYRSGPVADRIVVKATDAAGKERRVQVVVYTDVGETPKAPAPTKEALGSDPTATVPKPRPAQFRIDLAQLHVHVQDATLTAINLFDRTTYFRTPCDASPLKALAANFPPVPVPQIEFAYAADTLLGSPTPLTTGATWTSIESGVEVGRPMLILKGSSPGATLTLAFDRQTNRLRRFTAEFAGAVGSGLAKLELTSSPADAGVAKNWLLPVDGRTLVDSPALLVPPRSGLAEGSSIKHASLMTRELAPMTPESLFDQGSDAAAPQAVALVTFRSEAVPDGEGSEDLAAAISAACEAVKIKGGRAGVIGLLGKGTLDPEQIEKLTARLTALATDRGVAGGFASLLTASEVLSIERGGQPVETAIIVVGPDLKVLGVVVADDRADESAKLQAEVESFLSQAGPSVPTGKPADPKDKPSEPKGSPGVK